MREECLICKAPLEYLEADVMMQCALCQKKELSKALTKTIELIPGKTENWIMTSIDDEAFMTFAGSEEPTAMITLKTFGQPAQKYYDMVTAGFCETSAIDLACLMAAKTDLTDPRKAAYS